MSENTLKIIKIASILIIIVMIAILIPQYSTLITLKNKNALLKSELKHFEQKYETIERYKQEIIENKEELIDEYFREELDMILKNEQSIKY